MRNKKETLWTKDFSCITVATILSAIGGEAMNLPLSLLVFEETQSTFLAALLLICGMLPDVILPILVAPVIDRGTKKKMDCRTGCTHGTFICSNWSMGGAIWI